MKREDIKHAMCVLYSEARYERKQLRKDFDPKDYEWHVSTEIFGYLRDMTFGYNIYDYKALYAYDIKVTCCPFSDGIVLVHRIGGIEL